MKPILITRTGAMGDVLFTTPIVARLAQDGYEVTVRTACPAIFLHNPHVKKVIDKHTKIMHNPRMRKIDLDMCYEKSPKMHVIDAYSMAVFGDTRTSHRTMMYSSDEDVTHCMRLRPFRSYIVVHMGVGWENRTMPEVWWTRTVEGIRAAIPTHDIVMVGRGADMHHLTGLQIHDMYDRLSLHALGEMIGGAALFIGPDSLPLNMAQTTPTPCVGIYTCARWEYRRTSDALYPVTPSLDCYGCLHDAPPPVTYIGCRRGDFACVRHAIRPEDVIQKTIDILTTQ